MRSRLPAPSCQPLANPLTTNPTIRAATSADLPVLMHLERQSPTSAHWSEMEYGELFSQNARRLVLVAEPTGNKNAAGFLIAHQIDDEWELENIVVSPSEQGKGIGTKLLAGLISTAKKANGRAVFLEVRASNLAARRVYEKSGFRQTGVRKSYYQNPLDDAILYRLNLR